MQDIQHIQGLGGWRGIVNESKAMHLKSVISPRGDTVDKKQEDLIKQLQRQNTELRVIIEDIYRRLDRK